MNVRFFAPGQQYLKYKDELDKAWEDVAERGDLILRQDVEEFENNLAEFVGTKYAVGFNSGTDALFLSLNYLGIKEGDEVITGAKPVLVNVGEDGMMDVDEVKEKINEKTKAIIPVHLMGDMVDMHLLMSIAGDIPVIEDACQALGADFDGMKAGAFGLTGCFSFYPAKILGCFGDGGAITTNDKALAEELKNMRNHYKYNPGKWGFNSRLDNIQAVFLNIKIKYLPEMLENRQRTADLYNQWITSIVKKPTKRPGRVYQDYIIRTDKRDELAEFLLENGIETMKNDYHFPSDCPKPAMTILLEEQTLRLPCNDLITEEEAHYVISKINEFFKK